MARWPMADKSGGERAVPLGRRGQRRRRPHNRAEHAAPLRHHSEQRRRPHDWAERAAPLGIMASRGGGGGGRERATPLCTRRAAGPC